ncbi:hemi-methylated DNA binding protein-like protein [Sarcoptes scabiei]|uniref:RING-type E3 ubiquitin transferase n=1 Tax=Sarcoptes scabiei TaxID=52283 RepID=A0A132ACZ6_SARSC|nr:hemi-methylated DNA binding protein-like protein [Sarcoptes scabiei]
MPGRIEPDCSGCRDSFIQTKCNDCGCQVCHLKTEPSKQLICDECNQSFHLWCLKEPLESVPNENDWYCDRCRNETQQDLIEKHREYLDRKVCGNNWGFGMACVGRSFRLNDGDRFGPIEGIVVGSWWRFRVQVSEAGIHSPLATSIYGRQNDGVYSIVYSGCDHNDVDLGDEIYYTVHERKNRRKLSSSSETISRLQGFALALARNCNAILNDQRGSVAIDWRSGKPIRLLRNGNNRCNTTKSNRLKYLPKIGVRYDGIYKVVKYWPEAGTNGHTKWRFLLRRDDPEPAPWTEKGRYRSKKLDLHLQYPQGWCEEFAQKRLWRIDKKILDQQRQVKRFKSNRGELKHSISKYSSDSTIEKLDQFEIPESLRSLIETDLLNRKNWSTILDRKYFKKVKVQSREKEF